MSVKAKFRRLIAAGAKCVALVGAATVVSAITPLFAAQRPAQDNRRPRLNLRAQPSVGVAPARVVLTAELVGGANDFEEYYCPTVDWEWGDETSSESTTDCPPYEAGKTEIKRRFTVEHVFRRAGSYKVYFRMKHSAKDIGAVSTTVQVQPGAGDIR